LEESFDAVPARRLSACASEDRFAIATEKSRCAEASFTVQSRPALIFQEFHAATIGTLLAILCPQGGAQQLGAGAANVDRDSRSDMPSALTEYSPEWEVFDGEQPELSSERAVLGEADETELAAELLGVRNERELDRFIGDLIRRAGRAVRTVVRSPIGQSLGNVLKDAAKSVLPLAGGAIGSSLSGPLGIAIGRGLAERAGQALGLELEGLSHEDQEFEAAKRFVRFANEAVKNAAASSADDPRAAAAGAARKYAPGLLRAPAASAEARSARGQHPHPSIPNRSVSTSHLQPAEETMHDIDRTQLETDPTMESYEFAEYEQMEWPGETEGVFSEAEEMQLAAELLEVRDEHELDQFLGDLIHKVGRKIGGIVRSPIGQAIGGLLKGVAKKALPLAGTALGTFVGGPLGAQIGSGLATAAGSALGLEAESWNQEDREFEGAKQFVRIAGDSISNAAEVGPGADPRAAAQAAVTQAAQTHAPGLLQPGAPAPMPPSSGFRHRRHRQNSGRWMRRGNEIVLFGV
jgi:uncharacterized protein (DUF697 family)